MPIENVGMGSKISCSVERNIGLAQKAIVSSVWGFECFDKNGNLKWTEEQHNLCTDEGLNALLDIMFHASTQITTWYVVIFEDDYTPLSTNTYAVPGYTESSAYTEATRPEFVEAAASGKVLSNALSKASFTMNATKTIYGGALVGGGTAASTISDVAGGGTLYCSVAFSEGKSVDATDVLKVKITLTGADV